MADDEPDNQNVLRETLLRGLAPEEEVAEALDVSRRTIQRLGLPYIRIGRRRMYVIAAARERILPEAAS